MNQKDHVWSLHLSTRNLTNFAIDLNRFKSNERTHGHATARQTDRLYSLFFLIKGPGWINNIAKEQSDVKNSGSRNGKHC